MSRVFIIDDDAEVRSWVRQVIVEAEKPVMGFGKYVHDILPFPHNDGHTPEFTAYDLHQKVREDANTAGDAVVLDLGLGKSALDGLEVTCYLRHCFVGTFVIHSDTFVDSTDVRAEARKLGILLGCGKYDPNLPATVKLARKISGIKQSTAGWSRNYRNDFPVPPYQEPSDFHALMERLWHFGISFDGTEESVGDWDQLQELQDQVMEHYRAVQRWFNELHKRWGDAAFSTARPRRFEWYCVQNPCIWEFYKDAREVTEEVGRHLAERGF